MKVIFAILIILLVFLSGCTAPTQPAEPAQPSTVIDSSLGTGTGAGDITSDEVSSIDSDLSEIDDLLSGTDDLGVEEEVINDSLFK
ncbi:MAG TPA: hypothetical protein VJK05_00960 [archaeon]|nr:hypothetical protein [archaeon]